MRNVDQICRYVLKEILREPHRSLFSPSFAEAAAAGGIIKGADIPLFKESGFFVKTTGGEGGKLRGGDWGGFWGLPFNAIDTVADETV